MPKMIFVLRRRADLTREQMVEEWSGEQHTALVRTLPRLTRWVQNRVTSAQGGPECDGIGELWFEGGGAMDRVLSSPEWAAAVEDARRFLDLERCGLLIVDEVPVAGLAQV
jgi:uncharacterized protein (TIGR02118 family)